MSSAFLEWNFARCKEGWRPDPQKGTADKPLRQLNLPDPVLVKVRKQRSEKFLMSRRIKNVGPGLLPRDSYDFVWA